MKKILFLLGFFTFAGTVFAGGIDLEFFGYKVCNVGFDVNPFCRDDGRSPKVCISSCEPRYYTLPARTVVVNASPSTPAKKDEKAIVVKDSSNVTIINHESQQTSRPVYAPTMQMTYPAVQYYTYPACYAYPAYYAYPSYYYRPCCYQP